LAERRLRDAELAGELGLVRQPVAAPESLPPDGGDDLLDRSLEGPGRAEGFDESLRDGGQGNSSSRVQDAASGPTPVRGPPPRSR
jgi:hypothetical protein